MRQKIEWIFYRITESQCCANCYHLKGKTCNKGNKSLKGLKLQAERDGFSFFFYGSACPDWR